METNRYFPLGFALYLIGQQIVFTVGLMPFMGTHFEPTLWRLAIYLGGCLLMIAGFMVVAFNHRAVPR